MKVSEKAYIAGAIDCDGYIGIRKQGPWISPVIEVCQAERRASICEYIHEKLGRGHLSRRNHSGNLAKKPIISWHVHKQDDCRKILLKIMPFLVAKKENAQRVLLFLAANRLRNTYNLTDKDAFIIEVIRESSHRAVLNMNTPPAETEREDTDDITLEEGWRIVKALTKKYREATVQSAE